MVRSVHALRSVLGQTIGARSHLGFVDILTVEPDTTLKRGNAVTSRQMIARDPCIGLQLQINSMDHNFLLILLEEWLSKMIGRSTSLKMW